MSVFVTLVAMGRDEQNLWDFLFSLFYAAVLFGGTWWLWSAGRLPIGITFFDAALVTLASFRITRLFVHDRIMQFVRDWFLDVTAVTDVGGNTVLVRELPSRGPRRTAAELLGCPWCFGLWTVTITTFAYFATPFAWLPILIFALAGALNVIHSFIALMGLKSESLAGGAERSVLHSHHRGTCG